MKKIGACLVFSALVSAAAAQTNAPVAPLLTNTPAMRAMSLQDCVAEAIKHNFDVHIEGYAPLLAGLSLDQAYAGYDPTLNLSVTHSHNFYPGPIFGTNGAYFKDVDNLDSSSTPNLTGLLPSGASYGLFGNVSDTYGSPSENAGGQAGVNLTQPLLKNLWIDSTRLAVIAAKNQVKQSEQGLRLQLITTVTAVETAYFELIYALENVDVQKEALTLAQTQLDEDRQRVQVGSLAPLDVQQDEAQVAQSRASLITAESTLGTDQRTLKNLITDDYSAWITTDIQPTMAMDAPLELFNLQDSWNKGMTQRPELLQARITLEQDGVQLKYDRNQLFPELDLVGTLGYNGAGEGYSATFNQLEAGNRPFWSYGAQLSMPLTDLGPRSAYKSQKAVIQQDLLKLKQLEQSIMVQIDNAIGVARSDYESVQATKQARIYAEAALDAEQKKYAVGKSTTFTVLQLQNTLTSDRAAEIRALANYQESLTTLAQLEGSTLERRNVDVMVK